MKSKEWENHPAYSLMYNIDPTIWVQANAMTEKEKQENPKWETTEGFLKKITLKEAWSNAWNNWSEENKTLFKELPNFSPEIFKEITGIEV